MKKIFCSAGGLRSGWRLLIFVGLFVTLGFMAKWSVHRIPAVSRILQLPFLHPVGLIWDELEGLLQVGIATWIMARIERRRLASYGIPLRNAFGLLWSGQNAGQFAIGRLLETAGRVHNGSPADRSVRRQAGPCSR